MGMDSQKLSARLRQPGHDRTFRESEENFIRAARECLDPEVYDVIPNPDDLIKIFRGVEGARDLGVRPEAAIINKRTGRRFFVEVKKQGARGNAEERAAKHHTVQFYETLKSAFGYDFHPYVTIFCQDLATDARYTTKFPYLYEPDHYLLWVDYDLELVCLFLRERCAAWLD
jgi:hypothetical protein